MQSACGAKHGIFPAIRVSELGVRYASRAVVWVSTGSWPPAFKFQTSLNQNWQEESCDCRSGFHLTYMAGGWWQSFCYTIQCHRAGRA